MCLTVSAEATIALMSARNSSLHLSQCVYLNHVFLYFENDVKYLLSNKFF